MAFSTISLSPGIFSDEASGDAESRYVASDMIRFHRGRPQILGGWQAATSDLVPGVARQIIQWADTDGREYAAIGTHKRVQILFGGELTDITPLSPPGPSARHPSPRPRARRPSRSPTPRTVWRWTRRSFWPQPRRLVD